MVRFKAGAFVVVIVVERESFAGGVGQLQRRVERRPKPARQELGDPTQIATVAPCLASVTVT